MAMMKVTKYVHYVTIFKRDYNMVNSLKNLEFKYKGRNLIYELREVNSLPQMEQNNLKRTRVHDGMGG